MPRTKQIMLYKFNELDAKTQQVVIDKERYCNVEYRDWWDYTYEDAERAGINITGFDEHFCFGNLIDHAKESIDKIIEDHGPDCETRKIAERYKLLFLADATERRLEGYEDDGGDALLTERYLKEILAAYRDILRKEEEYLTSDEAVRETIEANDYEFDADGELQ